MFLTFEVAASPRKGLPSNQLRISQKLGAKQVLRTQSQNKVPRACVHTCFYMECDVTLIVYVEPSRTQWRESLYLAEALLREKWAVFDLEGGVRLPHSDERDPFRALRFLVPSSLEGRWGIADRKAGSLADA